MQKTLKIATVANRKQRDPHRVALVEKNGRFLVFVEKENYDSGRYLRRWLLATPAGCTQQGFETVEEAEKVFLKRARA